METSVTSYTDESCSLKVQNIWYRSTNKHNVDGWCTFTTCTCTVSTSFYWIVGKSFNKWEHWDAFVRLLLYCWVIIQYASHNKKKKSSVPLTRWMYTPVDGRGWRLIYRKTSCISRIKFQNLNVSRLDLQLSLPNPLKAGVKSSMKM